MEIITAKYYINLLKISTTNLDELIRNKKKLIIASNCISLVAGLTFHLLRNYKLSYSVNFNLKNEINENDVSFILTKNLDEIKNFDYYLEYSGDEENILCI